MTLLFSANSLILAFTSLYLSVRLTRNESRTALLSYAFILAWANIVVTTNALSVFSLLESPWIFFILSAAIQIAAVFATLLFHKQPAASVSSFAAIFRPLSFGKMNFFLYFIMALAFVMLVLCLTYIPYIPDTLAVKLPKIYFFLMNKSLLPYKEVNFELLWMAPVNASIAWLFFIIYKVKLTFIMLFSLVNWLISGLACYAISRKLNSTRSGSFLATGLFLLSETVIMAATADSDDLFAVTPFAVGTLALLSWAKEPRIFYAFMVGIAFGLSLGNKPFMVFYYPVFIFALIYWIFRYKIGILFQWGLNHWRPIVIATLSAFVMLFGVMYDNLISRKHPLAFPKILAVHRNQSHDMKTFGINLVSQNYGLMITPFAAWYADLTHTRKESSKALDANASKIIQSMFGVNQEEVLNTYSAHANKTHIMDELYYDHSVQFGFLPHLAILCLLFLTVKYGKRYLLIIAIGSTFLIWDVMYCFHYKYISGILRYWMLIFVPVVPLLAISWDKVRLQRGSFFHRLVYWAFIGTIGMTSLSAIKALHKNYYRSTQALLEGRNRDSYDHLFSPRMREIVRKLRNFNLASYYTNPVFLYLQLNDSARVRYAPDLVENQPNILASPYETPLFVPHPFVGWRLVPVEVQSANPAFYTNAGICPDNLCFINNYDFSGKKTSRAILFRISQPNPDAQKPGATVEPIIPLKNTNGYEMQIFERMPSGEEKAVTDWQPIAIRTHKLTRAASAIVIKIRDIESDDIYTGEYAYHAKP